MPANKGRNVVLGIAATMLVGVVIVLSNGAKMLEAGDELVSGSCLKKKHPRGKGCPRWAAVIVLHPLCAAGRVRGRIYGLNLIIWGDEFSAPTQNVKRAWHG